MTRGVTTTIAILILLFATQDAVSKPAADEKPAIVIAGGFMGMLGQPMEYFKKNEYSVTVVPYDFFAMGDIQNYARVIAGQVNSAYIANGRHRVVLVGYSLGGLAGLYALKRYRLANRVSTFIAVGAPFHGTKIAWFAVPTGVWTIMGLQTNPCSGFHKDLHADPLPVGTTFVSISGKRDNLCPPATSYLEGAINISVDRNHDTYFIDDSIFRIMEVYF